MRAVEIGLCKAKTNWKPVIMSELFFFLPQTILFFHTLYYNYAIIARFAFSGWRKTVKTGHLSWTLAMLLRKC